MYSVGMDLGTTYSCAAVMHDGQVEIVPNDQGHRITNSCVAFTEDGGTLVGGAAARQQSGNVINTAYDVKRFIGRKFSDATVQSDMKNFPFEVVDDDDKPKIRVQYKNGIGTLFAPEEVSAMILRELKTIVQCYIGEENRVRSAVITVPAHFSDAQRRATKLAAEIAGLKVVKMINEPTAAALAYGLESKKGDAKRNVLIYDLGGGTFDATVLTIDAGFFDVKATGGDTHLGGQDFNTRLYQHFLGEFTRQTGLDMSRDPIARQKLYAACEQVKRELSTSQRVEAHVDNLYGGKDFTAPITRARFEHLLDDLFSDTIGTVEEVLAEAKLENEEIDDVVLVGGSTRIPYVRELLTKHFGQAKLCKNINPDEAVAYGAAVHAAMLTGDATPKLENMRLRDVTSLSLGVEEGGFKMDFVIKRNTTIPTKASRSYLTSQDNQTSMTYKIFEGERALTKQNHLLGSVTLTNLPALPKGKVKTKLTFDIDENGVLKVTAKDKSRPDNEKTFKVLWDKGRWNDDEIAKMIKDAEKFKLVDDMLKKTVTSRASLEAFARESKEVAAEKQGTREDRAKLLRKAQDTLNWLGKSPNANVFAIAKKRKDLDAAYRPFKSPTKF